MTDTRLEEILTVTALLGAAIRSKDWSRARQLWERLTAMHPQVAVATDQPHVAAVLRNEEAMVYPHSDSVH